MNQQVINEEQVLKILRGRFLSAEHIVFKWNEIIKEQRTSSNIPLLEAPEVFPIRYFEETIELLAEDKNWFLIYDPGFSLRDNWAILGTTIGCRPNHNCKSKWWFRKDEDQWASKPGVPGYYLINMEGLFGKKRWEDQECLIQEMGREFYRAPSRIATNAYIARCLLNRKGPLENYEHWGPEKICDEQNRVVIGFTSSGLFVNYWPSDGQAYKLRVYIIRKFDV